MSRRRPLAAALLCAALGSALAWAALADPRAARADEVEDAALLAAPEKASDPERLRRAAEDALARRPGDAAALGALLCAVGRLKDRDLLDDAIARASTPPPEAKGALRGALGSALLVRARLDDPPDRERLRAAADALAFAETDGSPRDALDLGYARHLLGEVDGARRAYDRAVSAATTSPEDEETGDRAVAGLRSLARNDDARLSEWLSASTKVTNPALRGLAETAERRAGAAAALAVLGGPTAVLVRGGSVRTDTLRARLLRSLGRDAEALPVERRAVEGAGTLRRGDATALDAVERLWREKRPLASFEDCAALERDYDDLVRRAEGFPRTQAAWLNNVALRLREVVSTYTWRGEGRTQKVAEGAPPQVLALLSHCVALYDGAVSLVPKDAVDRPFEERWFWAAVLNDTALMRHYFLDVRDLDAAEALYLRAFELTDGAYMDTYDYNLQYLYGFERPGSEERWLRVARRAAGTILAEAPGGGFVPDEAKRDAARRDAEALERLLADRAKPR